MVQKFTGTGFNANALLLDFLRDQQGNPLKTPNSFLVLHNPVRQKCNEIIDQITDILAGSVAFSTVKVGNQSIQETDINNWNTAYTNNHSHTNKNYLDTINQALASTNTPLFAGLTAYNGNIIANSNPNESFIIGRCSSSVGNVGGVIIDQGSTYRARFNATGTALSTGTITFYYEKADDKSLANGNFNFAGFNTVRISNNIVWHGGNDGTGSGLEADILDGQHGSYYLNTSNMTEGTNLFYTDTRSLAAITGGASTIKTSNLTPNLALISDASGKVSTLNSVNTTELGYLDGVTSPLQTQLNSKAGKAGYAANNKAPGWYRIAQRGTVADGSSDGGRASALFTVGISASGYYHESVSFFAGIQYTVEPTINVIDRTNLGIYASLQKIRLVYGSTYEGVALEVYLNPIQVPSVNVAFEMIQNVVPNGWTAVNWETGEIPAGHTSFEFDISNIKAGIKSTTLEYLLNKSGDISGLNSLTISGNISAGLITSNKTGVGSYDALTLYRNTSGVDRQSILFKASTLEMARISAELLTSQTANLVFQLCNADRFVIDIDGGAYVKNAGYAYFGIKAGVGSSQDLTFYENSVLSGVVRSGSPNQGISLENRVNSSVPFLRINNSGAVELYSKSAQDILLNAANMVNITGGSLSMSGYEVIDQNRAFTIDKLQPRAGSFFLDTKTHGYGLIIKADSETTNETGILIVNQPNVGHFYGYNYSLSQYSDLRFGGTKMLYYSQSNLAFGIDTTNPQALLDINGTLYAGSGSKIKRTTSGTTDLYLESLEGSNLALRLKEGSSIKAQFDYIAVEQFLRVYNVISQARLEIYNSGRINLQSFSSQNIDLTSAGNVNIASGNFLMGGVETINNTRKGTFNGLINTAPLRTTASTLEAWYRDILHYSSNSSSHTGYLILQTNINYASYEMVTIRLTGYDYSAYNDNAIDITVAGYAYSNGVFYRECYMSHGKRILTVRAARRIADNKLALIIGESSTLFQYPKFKVESLQAGYNAVAGIEENWSLTISTDISAYYTPQVLTEGSAYVRKDANSSLIPIGNNLYDIGSATYKFRKGYFADNIEAKKGTFLDDIVINKAAGNPAFQIQSLNNTKFQMYYDVTNSQLFAQNATGTNYFSLLDSGKIIFEAKNSQNIELTATLIDLHGPLGIWGNTVLASNGSLIPANLSDASAANNSLYYSNTRSKLCYKDYGGTVHELY